jgi:uncharacterized protein
MTSGIALDLDRLEELCRRRQIRRLALFGSALRDDFRPDSDIDLLVEPGALVSLFDFIRIRDELATLLGRDVDLVEENSLKNPYRRSEVLRTAETIYAT